MDLLVVNARQAGTPIGAAPVWLSIAGGRVLARGSGDVPGVEARRRVDLGGRVLAPAFVDHHVHLLNIGLSVLNRETDEMLFLDLASASSVEEISEKVAAAAAVLPPERWIFGKGWSQGAWGSGTLPDREPLDRAAPEHPVFLSRVDAHAAWVNAAALGRANVGRETPDPADGEIRRRPGGEPSGVLLERAVEPLLADHPPLDEEILRKAFGAGAAALAAQGLTEVFDAGFLARPGIVALNADLGRMLTTLAAADAAAPLAVRVWLMIPAPSELARQILQRPEEFRRLSARIGVSHLKLFADGALGSRGASLSHPYADDPATRGVVRMSEEEILEWSERAVAAGLDVATHAIGDAAVGRTLAAYERLLESRPSLDPARLRIEHFSYATREDQRRAAALGVVLSIQPNFVLPDDRGRAMEDARLGDRSRLAYAWGELDRAGARLAGGSDYFTDPFAPLFNLHAAATRSNERGRPAEGWHPEQRLTRARALALFTELHAAGGGPPRRRTLQPGELADLVILSADPLQAADAEIAGIRVHATLREGLPTYHDGSLPGLGTPP